MLRGIRLVQIMLVDAGHQLLDFSKAQNMSKYVLRMVVFWLGLAFITEVGG